MSNLIKVNNNDDEKKKGGGLFGALVTTKRDTTKAIAQTDTTFYNSRLKSGRIGFIIDATGSRSGTWEEAKGIQAKLFNEVGDLEVNVVHYGGGHPIKQTGWHDKAQPIISHMNSVECESGSTQILDSMRKFLADEKNPKVIILIGDAFEESEEEAMGLANKMKAKDMQLFALHEGSSDYAAETFRRLAETTGGSFSKFDRNVSLEKLIGAIKKYATDGIEGLKLLAASGDEGAKRIAAGMKLLGPS